MGWGFKLLFPPSGPGPFFHSKSACGRFLCKFGYIPRISRGLSGKSVSFFFQTLALLYFHLICSLTGIQSYLVEFAEILEGDKKC